MNFNSFTTLNYFTVGAFLAFSLFCCFLDSKYMLGNNSYPILVLRLYARHFKLALKILVGFAVAFLVGMGILGMAAKTGPVTTTGGGPETEQLAGFINRVTAPVQWVVDGFISLMGFIVLAILLGFSWGLTYYQEHPLPFQIIGIVLYLFWLAVTVYDLAGREAKFGAKKPEIVTLALGTALAWGLTVVALAFFFTTRISDARMIPNVVEGVYAGHVLDCGGVTPPDGYYGKAPSLSATGWVSTTSDGYLSFYGTYGSVVATCKARN